jgi:hypothetical protein
MKTVLPSFTTFEGLVSALQAPLSPSVYDITQESMAFIPLVDELLRQNSIPPRKRYYRKSNKAWGKYNE